LILVTQKPLAITSGGLNIMPFIYRNFIQSATAVDDKHTTAAHGISYGTLVVKRNTNKG